MLVIRGDKRVADIYFTEYMRLFAHYGFREAVAIAIERHESCAPAPQDRLADVAAAVLQGGRRPRHPPPLLRDRQVAVRARARAHAAGAGGDGYPASPMMRLTFPGSKNSGAGSVAACTLMKPSIAS